MSLFEEHKAERRERILIAARKLVGEGGYDGLTMRDLARAARVSVPTLYNLFGSKDQLVEAYLDARTDATRDQVERTLTRFRTPRERLLGVFDAQGQVFTQPDFNGCAHLTASAEAEAGSPVEYANNRYRQWVRTLFTDLAREAGVADSEDLARQLQLLYDGAGVSARMDRDPSAATTARAAAAALFDAATKTERAADAP